MTDDEKTTPLGLFNYAHSYWASAVALSRTRRYCTHKQAPVDYLYFHAIELYLKSFLRLRGYTTQRLRGSFSHGFVKLYDAALSEGLPEDDEVRGILSLIDANYLRARYIETGPFTTASPNSLWIACNVLNLDIEPQINANAGATRTRVVPTTT